MNQDIIRRAGEIIKKNTGEGTYCVLRFRTKRYNLLVDWMEVKGELLEAQK